FLSSCAYSYRSRRQPTQRDTLSLHDALPISRAEFFRSETVGRNRDLAGEDRDRRRPAASAQHPQLPQLAADERTRGVHPVHSGRSEEHTSELQSRENLVCRLLLEKKNQLQEH